jgi:hypothetical protein
MSTEQLLAFLQCQPFEPFIVTLVGGRELALKHPELFVPARAGLGVWILHETGHIEAIGVGLILSLRTIDPVDPSKLIG